MKRFSSHGTLFSFFAAICLLLAGAASLSAAPFYSIEELPTLGGSSSLAFGVYAGGAVVGQVALSDGST